MHQYRPTLSSLIVVLAISAAPSFAHAAITGFGDFSNFTSTKALWIPAPPRISFQARLS